MSDADYHPQDARSSRHQSGPGMLEKLVLIHLGVLFVFTTWAFGGQAPWVRQVIAAWGAVGVLLFIAACRLHHRAPDERFHPALRWLWPLLAYDLVVVAGCLNPGFKEVVIAGTPSLVLGNPREWLPSSARPLMAVQELWHFNVIVLSCFNPLLVLRSRRHIRGMLLLLGTNAVALAVFGTFQKLVGAKGLWFGLVHSPNARFFSTFIYHNHWGAFTVLNTAICVGLLFHHYRRTGHRDVWHSPVLLGAVATLLLALSVPLSASRSCTLMTGLLLTAALGHFLLRLIRQRREHHESVLLPITGIILAALVSVGAAGYLGRHAIAERVQQSSAQLTQAGVEGTISSRLTLYRDTWRMAAAKPWFGWGLESYAHVFRIFNTQRTAETWWWIPYYAEAHSDWLQSLAEVGFVGTGLLVLLGLLPLLAVRWRQTGSILPRYLLAGDALVLLYAWLEFPFANSAVLMTFCATFYCAIHYARLDLQGQREDSR